MMNYQIVDKDSRRVLFKDAKIAKSFWQRLVGLMFKNSIGIEKIIIFYNASSIHTFFMRFPIDIIFLGDRKSVV